VLKPGRVAVVHVAQIPRMKRAGGVGLFDFRGLNIRLGERAGAGLRVRLVRAEEPAGAGDPHAQPGASIRRAESDRAKSRGALPDYLLKFRAPGRQRRAGRRPG
jgi:hypothetical protein